jgi:O-antigen ligase
MTLLAATVAQRRSASVIIGVLVLQIGLFGLLFWSGSRAGLMAIGIMMIMAPLFVRHFSWKLLCLNLSSAIIGAGASALMYIPGSSYSIIKRATPSIRDGSTTSQALDQVSSGRLELYQWVIARIMEKPWFGYGYLPMGDMLGEGATVYHAHNVVLEYALGFGIPVAILVICLIMWIFLRGVVAVRTSESPYILCGLYLALLLPIYSMFSGVLLAPYQYILFGSVLGGLLGTRIAQENPSAPESDAPEKKSIPVDDIMASL